MIPFQGSAFAGSTLRNSPLFSGDSSLSIFSNSETDSMQSLAVASKAGMAGGSTTFATGMFSSRVQESTLIATRSCEVDSSASNNSTR